MAKRGTAEPRPKGLSIELIVELRATLLKQQDGIRGAVQSLESSISAQRSMQADMKSRLKEIGDEIAQIDAHLAAQDYS